MSAKPDYLGQRDKPYPMKGFRFSSQGERSVEIPFTENISYKQARSAVLVAVVLGILFSIAQITLDLRNEKNLVAATVHQVLNTAKDTAAEAAFNLDKELGQKTINGLFAYQPIFQATIRDELGTVIAHGEHTHKLVGPHFIIHFLSDFTFGDVTDFTTPLILTGDRDIPAGEMTVRVDVHLTASNFIDRAWMVLVFGLLRNIILAMILTGLFFLTFTKPLVQSVTALRDARRPVESELFQASLPKGHERDEIGLLVHSINSLTADIHKSEERFRTLFQNMAQGVFYQQADGRLTDVNSAALRMFGLTEDQFLGRTSLDPRWHVVQEDGSDLPGEKHPSMLALNTGKIRNVVAGVANPQRKEITWLNINAIPRFREGEDKPFEVFITLHDITMSKRDEEALREREERYRSVIATCHDGFWVTDMNGCLFEVNDAYVRQSGYFREELLSMSVSDLDVLDNAADVAARIKRIVRSGSDLFTSQHRTKSGEIWDVEVSISYVEIEGGLFFCFFRDITERKRAEEALAVQTALLNETQRLTKVGGWRYDVTTQTMTWTDELYRIHGFSKDQYESGSQEHIEHSIECYDPEDRQEVLAAFERCISEGEPYDLEFPFMAANGSRKWIRTAAQAIRKQDRIVSVVGNVLDITEQKEAEVRFRKSEERLLRAESIAHMGHWRFSVEDEVLDLSAEVCRLFGYDPATYRPTVAESIACYHSDDQDEVRRLVGESIETGKGFEFDVRMVRTDGAVRNVYAKGECEFGEDGKVTALFGVFQDITEDKQTEQTLRQAMEQAEFANRSKTEFLANMSHELRTPLTTINGGADILSTEMFGPIDNPLYLDYAKNIREAGEHLLGVVNDLLDISQIEIGRLELNEKDLDVREVLSACHKLMNGRASELGLELGLQVAEGLPILRGDELRIKQVVLNLLSNSVKFTPKGGTVILKGETDGEGRVALAVADTGIGIASKDIDKAMIDLGRAGDPFKRDVQGAGLGLPLSKRLTELHGGTLEIESEPGVGTTVTVRFPLERAIK